MENAVKNRKTGGKLIGLVWNFLQAVLQQGDEFFNISLLLVPLNFGGGMEIYMTYKTIVIDYAPKAKKMAAAVENKANEMALKGWELISFSVTRSAKVILLFRVSEAVCGQVDLQDKKNGTVGDTQ